MHPPGLHPRRDWTDGVVVGRDVICRPPEILGQGRKSGLVYFCGLNPRAYWRGQIANCPRVSVHLDGDLVNLVIPGWRLPAGRRNEGFLRAIPDPYPFPFPVMESRVFCVPPLPTGEGYTPLRET